MKTAKIDKTTSIEVNYLAGQAYTLQLCYPSALTMLALRLNIPDLPKTPTDFALYVVTKIKSFEKQTTVRKQFRELCNTAEEMGFHKKFHRPKTKSHKGPRPIEEPLYDPESSRHINAIRRISSINDVQAAAL